MFFVFVVPSTSFLFNKNKFLSYIFEANFDDLISKFHLRLFLNSGGQKEKFVMILRRKTLLKALIDNKI